MRLLMRGLSVGGGSSGPSPTWRFRPARKEALWSWTWRSTAAGVSALERAGGPIPETARARTGGGEHIFRCPAEVEFRSIARLFGPALDLRGEGGYLVMPPSRTEVPYGWIDHSPRRQRGWLRASWSASESRRFSERGHRGRSGVPTRLGGTWDMGCEGGKLEDTMTCGRGLLKLARGMGTRDS